MPERSRWRAQTASLEHSIRVRFEAMRSQFNERTRRLWAAAEVKAAGPGSISLVSRATGICRQTIARACREQEQPSLLAPGTRLRRAGAGAPRLVVKNPALLADLERLIEPSTRGDPESPLRWTCKSTRNLAEALQTMGHPISHDTVARLLHEQDYSLQANRKIIEGTDHPDRDEQFHHISQTTKGFLEQGQPAISVDTKKKELVGNFKNAGREWEPVGQPRPVQDHDFLNPLDGKITPHGVYDLADNTGWVSVGIDHDTAEFAVESIRRWWTLIGKAKYPHATQLLVTADGGGSNGYRLRLWKVELQKLADEIGVAISVCHFPPGTSKWNKIEHQLFSFISINWRGRPLTDYQTIVGLIGATKTRKGLVVRCDMDTNRYATGIQVSDNDMEALNITRHPFHGEWNYTLAPRRNTGKPIDRTIF
jgi:hypothetical protein